MVFHWADRAGKSSAKSSTWDKVHNLYSVLYSGKWMFMCIHITKEVWVYSWCVNCIIKSYFRLLKVIYLTLFAAMLLLLLYIFTAYVDEPLPGLKSCTNCYRSQYRLVLRRICTLSYIHNYCLFLQSLSFCTQLLGSIRMNSDKGRNSDKTS